MYKLFATFLSLTLIFASASAWAQEQDPFPYPLHTYRLDNGLTVILVPTEHRQQVALSLVMKVGSRNETQKGHTGFAHFFEHLMFRGTPDFPPEKARNFLLNAGINDNAWTWDDMTNYHEVFTPADLDAVLAYESDRFQNLSFDEAAFKTEALAVLGEYNKNASNPQEKMFETLHATAFQKHTYSHTTMGYLEDIKNYPNLYQACWTFFDRFYRPEYATLILVGDIQEKEALAKVKKHFGAWERGQYQSQIPTEPVQQEPREAKVLWENDTPTRLFIAYKTPPFESYLHAAGLEVFRDLYFDPSSKFVYELKEEKQWVDEIKAYYWHHKDPYLFIINARLKKGVDPQKVADLISQRVETFAFKQIDETRLKQTQKHILNDFTLSLDNANNIADSLTFFSGLSEDPQRINRYYQALQKLSGDDIKGIVHHYFQPQFRTTVTLTSKERSR